MSQLFALVSQTKLVPPRDLYRLCRPLEENARDCAQAWSREPPAIVVCDDVSKLPIAQPVVFVDDDGGDPSALGIHHWDPLRGTAARVFVTNSTGLNMGKDSVVEVAGHEILEAIVDPRTSMWCDYPMPNATGIQVAMEVCDPVQDSYPIRSMGTDWQVANFVTPEWFDRRFLDPKVIAAFMERGGSFDHARTLKYPGQIGRDGYVVLRRQISPARFTNYLRGARGPDFAVELLERKNHPWARTQQRLA